MLNKELKTKIITSFARSSNDTGSSEVQVALWTERIKHIADHLSKFPKDNHSRLGLVKLVGKRKRALVYLERTDKKRFAILKQQI